MELESAQRYDWKDVMTISIPARGDKEYKLHLDKGATFEYAWATEGKDLFFDFHGEPKGDTSGYFKSFKKHTSSQESGSLTASFEGTHGWYWKNNTQSPVIIVLKTKGSYRLPNLNKAMPLAEPLQIPVSTTHDSIDSL